MKKVFDIMIIIDAILMFLYYTNESTFRLPFIIMTSITGILSLAMIIVNPERKK